MTTIRFVTVLGLLLVLFPVAGVNSQQSVPHVPELWTAEKAVAFAISQNPESEIAQKRIEQSRATAAMISAVDYPQVNLLAEYGLTNNPMYSFGNILNQGAFDDAIDFNDPGQTDNLQLKAEVLYRLYNGGRDKASKQSANAQVEMSSTDLTAVHQQLGFEIVKTFQGIVQAENMVDVRKESLEAISAAVEVGQARYDAGDLLRQDILNLELQRSRASENLIQSRHNLELTKRSFLNLLGLNQGSVKVDPLGSPNQLLPETIDHNNRPEMKKLAALETSAVSELNKARGGRMPTVDAYASYQYDYGWELDGSGDSWIAGLRLNYALYDGRKTSSEVTLARLKVEEIQSLRKKTELFLNLEIQQAQLDYEQARERKSVTEKMVAVAEEVARLSRVRFREGVILASDLIDFEMRLSDAKSRHLAASANYQVAIANLRRAAGLKQFDSQ
ncbi:MAG: TolC family protein [Desulforhopalus sp.]